ncbi:MAG: nickel pincer cofactor biosynthesis protein LarC [Chloroflexota bacterium]|nr:nickel pincer cofactor biosynthesis protein LarC [Chloroflexota bacterium]
MRAAYIQSVGGASGDMLLGALVDLGASLEDIRAELDKLAITGYSLSARTDVRCEIRGTKVDVQITNNTRMSPAEMLAIVADSSLSPSIKNSSIKILNTLWAAESRVHGHSMDEIELDELGTMDTIVDVVGVCVGLDLLEVKEIYASPLILGSASPAYKPGGYPNPAPATLEIVATAKAPVAPDNLIYDGVGELTTPTGAAIIASLADFHRPAYSVSKIGVGLGGKNPEFFSNALKIWLGEVNGGVNNTVQSGIVLLETNLDDVTGEVLGYTQEKLFDLGALDVWFTSIQMKKNRPGILFSVLIPEDLETDAVNLILIETPTLGVRRRHIDRYISDREVRSVETEWGLVQVKLKLSDGVIMDVSPEYEDCRRISAMSGIPFQAIFRSVSEQARDQLGLGSS